MHWFFKSILVFSTLILSWLVLAFILPEILPTKNISNTKIYGLIIQKQIWQGEINVIGDLITVPGATVTLKPGTHVSVSRNNDRSNFDLLPAHLKSGINNNGEDHGVKKGEPFWDEKNKIQLRFSALFAEGNAKNKITISSDDPKGSPYDINLISISRGQINYVQFSNYRKLLIGSNVSVLNNEFLNTGDCAICVDKGGPKIENNTFKSSVREYIVVGVASPIISKNRFLESSGDGLLFHGIALTNVIVSDNYFQIPSKKAIKVIAVNEGGVITRNLFSTGDIELPCNSKVKLVNNSIYTKLIFSNIGNCEGIFTIDENYWDIKDKDSILKSRIVGLSEKYKVELSKVLMKTPNGVQSR